jgi:selenocysteine lyase/cysteine desulfurase
VADALRRVQREWETGEFAWTGWEAEAHATRSLFADLINADPEEVALVSAVSYSASAVAASLPVGRVVVGTREFRSNYYPWIALADRGFDVTTVEATDDDVVPTDALIEAIDDDTVLVAVSEVQSINGYRVDLPRLIEAAHRRGARVFVDSCQSLGAIRHDVQESGADFVATHGYKWLLSPRAAAWLYVRRDRLDEIRPFTLSWQTPEDPYAEYYGGPLDIPKSARKLDVSLAWFSWPGARAALELLHSLDREAVERRALELAALFRTGAEELGFRITPQELPSQIVGVAVPDANGLSERLREHHVVAAVRGGFLRIGFHAFNDEGDVERGLAALAE